MLPEYNVTRVAIAEQIITPLFDTSCSSNIAKNDFYLFRNLKKPLHVKLVVLSFLHLKTNSFYKGDLRH